MSYSASSYPYDTVVRITDTLNGVHYQASGVLISPDEVLTAAHVVYDSTSGLYSDLVVTPAANGSTGPFGSANGVTVHYFPIQDAGDLIPQTDSAFDVAVIHLDRSFSNLGSMSFLANWTGGTVDVTGYPASAGGAQANVPETLQQIPGLNLWTGGATGRGSSGGPAWIAGPNGPQIVGVVSSESLTTNRGFFARIDSSVLAQIESWVAQDDGAAGAQTAASAPISAGGGGSPGVSALANNPTMQVALLYQAALGRLPDAPGLADWTGALTRGGMTLQQEAASFMQSPEFMGRFGAPNTGALVTLLYQNTLDRAPDSAGFAAWTGAIDSGAMTVPQVITGFAESPENLQLHGPGVVTAGFVQA